MMNEKINQTSDMGISGLNRGKLYSVATFFAWFLFVSFLLSNILAMTSINGGAFELLPEIGGAIAGILALIKITP